MLEQDMQLGRYEQCSCKRTCANSRGFPDKNLPLPANRPTCKSVKHLKNVMLLVHNDVMMQILAHEIQNDNVSVYKLYLTQWELINNGS